MTERKSTEFDRPGGYAMPKGAAPVQREAAKVLAQADIRLYGDACPAYEPKPPTDLKPAFSADGPIFHTVTGSRTHQYS